MYKFVDEKWFKAMLSGDRSLPTELIGYVDLSDVLERDEKIQISLQHVQRSLSLYQLDNRAEEDDYEQVWWDVITFVEDISYYCVMALPILRHVVEDYCEFTPKFRSCDTQNESIDLSEYWRKCIDSYDDRQSKFMSRVLKLSRCAKKLDSSFNRVSDAKELGKLSLDTYTYCSEVIYLSTQVISNKP